jgi:hypothetical protein
MSYKETKQYKDLVERIEYYNYQFEQKGLRCNSICLNEAESGIESIFLPNGFSHFVRTKEDCILALGLLIGYWQSFLAR